MIHYKDKVFCGSKVKKHTCGREFTKQDAIDAEKWWGGKDYPVAYGDMCRPKKSKLKELREFREERTKQVEDIMNDLK